MSIFGRQVERLGNRYRLASSDKLPFKNDISRDPLPPRHNLIAFEKKCAETRDTKEENIYSRQPRCEENPVFALERSPPEWKSLSPNNCPHHPPPNPLPELRAEEVESRRRPNRICAQGQMRKRSIELEPTHGYRSNLEFAPSEE